MPEGLVSSAASLDLEMIVPQLCVLKALLLCAYFQFCCSLSLLGHQYCRIRASSLGAQLKSVSPNTLSGSGVRLQHMNLKEAQLNSQTLGTQCLGSVP